MRVRKEVAEIEELAKLESQKRALKKEVLLARQQKLQQEQQSKV